MIRSGNKEQDVSRNTLMLFYTNPSFKAGYGRALDVFGDCVKYNTSRSDEEADSRAFYADMSAIAEDLNHAFHITWLSDEDDRESVPAS